MTQLAAVLAVAGLFQVYLGLKGLVKDVFLTTVYGWLCLTVSAVILCPARMAAAYALSTSVVVVYAFVVQCKS